MRFFDRFKKGGGDPPKQPGRTRGPAPRHDVVRESGMTLLEEAQDAMSIQAPGFYDAVVAMSKNDSEETRLAFHKVVLGGMLWYPIDHHEDGRTSSPAYKTPDGEVVWPVYTHIEAMELDGYPVDGHFIISKPDLIFQTAEDSGFTEVCINPSGPAGGKVAGMEIAFLARGRSPYGDVREGDPQSMTAGVPREAIPQKLKSLVHQFAKREGLRALYFVDLVIDEKEHYPTVYFDFSDRGAKIDELTEKIYSELRPSIMGTPYVLAPVRSQDELDSFVHAGVKIYP